jgi:hypothetical protein
VLEREFGRRWERKKRILDTAWVTESVIDNWNNLISSRDLLEDMASLILHLDVTSMIRGHSFMCDCIALYPQN